MTTLSETIELGKSPLEQRFISIQALSELLRDSGDSLIVYGAGVTCSETIKCLIEAHILPVCIADQNPAKINTTIMHIPVLSPVDALIKAGDSVICAVAIWSIGTFYKELMQQLINMGYKQIFFLSSPSLPRVWNPTLATDVQQNKSIILEAANKLNDPTSIQRYEEFIYSFISSRVDNCGVLGHYKSLDGELLNNDLIRVNHNDVVVRCRNGFQDDHSNYLETLSQTKTSYLFEPSRAGRIKCKEYIYHKNIPNIFVYPFLLGKEETEVQFDEKIYFTRFIDQEEYFSSRAISISLDTFVDEINPTLLHLDLTGKYLEVLQGSEQTINNSQPIIMITGFRRASEVAQIMNSYPQYKYYFRNYGGITISEGYALIIFTGNYS